MVTWWVWVEKVSHSFSLTALSCSGPRGNGSKAGIHPGCDAFPSQDPMCVWHIHTLRPFSKLFCFVFFFFWRWEETGEPRGHPLRHGENLCSFAQTKHRIDLGNLELWSSTTCNATVHYCPCSIIVLLVIRINGFKNETRHACFDV